MKKRKLSMIPYTELMRKLNNEGFEITKLGCASPADGVVIDILNISKVDLPSQNTSIIVYQSEYIDGGYQVCFPASVQDEDFLVEQTILTASENHLKGVKDVRAMDAIDIESLELAKAELNN